jgi:predicted DNA-binding transcriptional regulator AlpA
LRSHDALPPNLPPRGLSRAAAAQYVGIGQTKFDELVADGKMPRPFSIGARKLWDLRALNQAIDALAETANEANEWDE